MTLSACTVSSNFAVYGGGVPTFVSDPPTLVDTIVAGNTLSSTSGADPDIDGPVAAASAYNLIGIGTGLSGISNGAGGNQIGTSAVPINPLLAPLGNYGGNTETMQPQAGSPALDAGGSLTTLTKAMGPRTPSSTSPPPPPSAAPPVPPGRSRSTARRCRSPASI